MELNAISWNCIGTSEILREPSGAMDDLGQSFGYLEEPQETLEELGKPWRTLGDLGETYDPLETFRQ